MKRHETRLYNIWRGMRQRCLSPLSKRYGYYGGRGIQICREWASFEVFKAWSTTHGYTNRLTIDRRNNNGNYEPANCRWVTQAEQNRNRRSQGLVEEISFRCPRSLVESIKRISTNTARFVREAIAEKMERMGVKTQQAA